MTIGQRICAKRQELGWSQEELAKKMGYKTRNAIYQYEKAENMKLSLIQKFSDVLGCTTSYLMGWDEEVKNLKEDEILIFSQYADNDVFDGKAISTKTYDREPTKEELNFLFLLSQLNDDGLNEALKRIEELTQLDKYKKVWLYENRAKDYKFF